MTDLKETYKTSGILGLVKVPLCFLIGHNFWEYSTGRVCKRCKFREEWKKEGDKKNES